MRIAVWDEPALDFFTRSAEEIAQHRPIQLVRMPRIGLRNQLIMGEVDVALVPTLTAYRDHELFEVLPAVAISSWDFPFLRLHLPQGLSKPIHTIAIDPSLAQEALISKIVLKEHYDIEPSFRPIDAARGTPESETDGTLFLGTGTDALQGQAFDLGRDWFELTHYPMVWGVFVARKGEASVAMVEALREIAGFTEVRTPQWLEESELPDTLQTFYKEGIRYRLDDLATAGLTTLQDYLYYNKAVEEMPPLPFYKVPDGEADDEMQPLV